MEDKRDIFIQRLTEDLLGPLKKDEILKVSPENTYLNGILSPSDAHEPDEQDDETDPIVQNSDTYDEIKDRISNNKIRRYVKNNRIKPAAGEVFLLLVLVILNH